MDTQTFIDKVATGDAVGAQTILNDLLSARAFEALDAKKVELAQTIFNGDSDQKEVTDIEVQDTADTPVEQE
jgi:hypothetical protein